MVLILQFIINTENVNFDSFSVVTYTYTLCIQVMDKIMGTLSMNIWMLGDSIILSIICNWFNFKIMNINLRNNKFQKNTNWKKNKGRIRFLKRVKWGEVISKNMAEKLCQKNLWKK